MVTEGASFQQRAIAAQQAGEHLRALDLFLRAIDQEPRDWIALTCLGNSLRALKRFGDAIAVQRRAIDLSGDHRAMSNLALTYRDAGRLDDAIDLLGDAIARAPDAAELHGNLSGFLLKAERPAEAAAAARRALALDPGHARAESNLGYALKEQGQLVEAVLHFRRAIAARPDDADAHWNLGISLLAAPGGAQDESDGWRELEWRQQIPGLRVPVAVALLAVPVWNGEPLEGRTLLLQAEQGLGDTLMFARYARLAKSVCGAGKVVLECQPPLERLLRRCAGVDAVVARGRALPTVDARASLFSLPMLLGGRAPDRGGPPAAYLSAEPERALRWRAILAARGGGAASFKIGIAWQGNRQYRADGRRSIALACFVPFIRAARAAGADVFSLQKGEGREQLSRLPADVRAEVDDLEAELDVDRAADGARVAFVDTAAVMAGLDLIVTSDTAIPHLAGALDVPVWMPLAQLPDWRWGLAGERSSWYRRLRLFRQSAAGDWTGVFARVTASLLETLADARAGRPVGPAGARPEAGMERSA